MLTKIVNGVEEVMSGEEESGIRAEWSANEVKVKVQVTAADAIINDPAALAALKAALAK